MDLKTSRVLIDNCNVDLSYIEYDLLVLFLQNKNKIFSREDFLKIIWGESGSKNINDPRIVDSHIKNLRKKIEVSSIKTIRGVGYQWIETLDIQ